MEDYRVRKLKSELQEFAKIQQNPVINIPDVNVPLAGMIVEVVSVSGWLCLVIVETIPGDILSRVGALASLTLDDRFKKGEAVLLRRVRVYDNPSRLYTEIRVAERL